MVKARRSALRLSQVALGKRTGLSQNYISKLERGEIELPQRGTLDALGRVLGISLSEFFRAAGIIEEEPGQDGAQLREETGTYRTSDYPPMPIAIPVYDQPISAGTGVPALQQYIYLPPDIDIRSDWYGLPVHGDCMAPVLLSGDTVIISPNATPEPGDMVVFDLDTEQGMVKWLRKQRNGELWLVPEQGDPIRFDEERVRIVGVVMRMWRNVRRPRKGLWRD